MMKALALTLLLLLACQAEAKIHRSATARQHFKQMHPCPANGKTRGVCPGWVIDHVIPLACNGLDVPANLQWQTRADALAKDKWERKLCAKSL